ncbi:late competence protein ComER [Paenibacillus massiliensis]|uniref:late competence protein ComER n=1 Tax=Paenibacillus massiliensis TaxID=225917 RepID=UPI000413A47C|nr:late competence protein ComER [Paenibacillus massiliensis]
MKVGFIGTGSMGSLLIDAFIAAGALTPQQIMASSRTTTKVLELAERHHGLHVSWSNRETADFSDILFICVKPLEYKCVLDEIKDLISPEQIVISITSPLQLVHLEKELPAKISKIIPSITNLTRSGSSLCVHGERMSEQDCAVVEKLMSFISRPVRIQEQHTRVASDFASCGPAFLAYFLQEWIQAATDATGVDSQTLCLLAGEMLIGTGKLLQEEGFTPAELQARVSVPGGITAEALRVLSMSLDSVFPELTRTTHAKYDEDVQKLDALFGDSSINQQRY